MGEIVKLDKDAERNPMLPFAGQYGPGLEHEADAELFDLVTDVKVGEGPAFDRDCARGPYWQWVFRVKHEDQLVFIRHFEPVGPNTGSRASRWLKALGVEMTADADGDLVLDTHDAIGRKCGIEVAAPRRPEGPEGPVYPGRLRNVIGL